MKVKLYKPFEHWYHGGTIFLISDTHFNDPDCSLMSDHWPTPDEYVKLINKFVGKNDTLIHLGDVGDESWISKIKGYKVLLLGNHDKGASNYTKVYSSILEGKLLFQSEVRADVEAFNFEYHMDHSEMPIYTNNGLFDEVYEGPLFINEKILLSHEPVGLPFGINIHGHDHAGLHYEYWANDRVMINVCSNIREFKPLRLDDLIIDFKVKDLHRVIINKATEKRKAKC